MAKRKAKKKTHRRRRVGALALNPSSPMVQIGSVVLGFLAGGTINPLINSIIPATMKTQANTGKMVAGVQLGIGGFLILSKGKKSMIKTVAGGLLAGAGLKRASIVFKSGTTDTLGGYGQVPVIGGYQNVPVIGSYTPNQSLNGYQTAPMAINGAKPTHSKIMGGMMKGSGSGVSNPGSDCMG